MVMATLIGNNFSSLCFVPIQLGYSVSSFHPSPSFRRILSAPTRASSAAAVVQTKPRNPIGVDKESNISKNTIACPICYYPFTWIGDSASSLECAPGSTVQCDTCKKTYYGKETHLDLTVSSGAKEYEEVMPTATEIFRSQLVSFLYERGWRQNFTLAGFPGPEKEFEMMKDYLKPVLGGNIVDASCGSGMFSRLFQKSGLFSRVVALDYSDNMLRQCYEFIQQEEDFPKENFHLVRADIARLPFATSSVDAVHAGAALHCWPSPSAAVAEISRVLRPGGVFVATTVVADGPFSLIPFPSNAFKTVMQTSGTQVFLAERELEELCKGCGLVDFTCVRNGLFIMISVTKPI